MTNEKPWYENGNVPERALESFRACAKYTDDDLAEIIDRRMPPMENDPFPTVKGSSRRSLDIMFYIEDILARDRFRQMATLDKIEKVYNAIPDEEVESTYLRFRAGLQKLPYQLHIGIEAPTDVPGMRSYMVKVQHVLEERQNLAERFSEKSSESKNGN
jgi:hypothetical protein